MTKSKTSPKPVLSTELKPLITPNVSLDNANELPTEQPKSIKGKSSNEIASNEDVIETGAKQPIKVSSDNSKAKKIGRPKKNEVSSKKVGNRGKVGRPAGDAAIINEYKARMLNSPKSRKVLESILDAALDDDHKNQSAAWKIVVDRILPVSTFDKAVSGNGRSSVNITISGLKEVAISSGEDEAVEADYEEID